MAIVAVALATASCVNANPTGGYGPLGVEDDGRVPILSPLTDVVTSTEPPRDCTPRPLAGDVGIVDDAAVATVQLSEAIYPCADRVVVATEAAVEGGVDAAIASQAAFLVMAAQPSDVHLAELARLAPESVVVYGLAADAVPGPWEVIDGSPGSPSSTSTTSTSTTTTTSAPSPESSLPGAWLVATGSPLLPAVAPAAAAAGAEIVEVGFDEDLRGLADDAQSVVAGADSVQAIGSLHGDASWQLDVVLAGVENPGGGQLLFPGRRLVALYGNPLSASLGVLGEQGPEETLERTRQVAATYETGDGVVVVPTFEIIATVASAQAGADNDYSAEMDLDDLRPWIELAGDNGTYVVLDLQPGRTDFLTQARRYEEFLRLPHVGLALDPEWRLEPDEVHLRQIGSVTAAEINTVSEWLAGIVREEALPQKLFLIHQFHFSMIQDRSTIETPGELAVVIQMDGQGPLTTKYETYAQLTAGQEGVGWRWGWKNFYDEDSPTATPEQTLEVDPEPVFVSYQ